MEKNRRQTARLPLYLPVRVTGYDRAGGKWQEITQSGDVSRSGVRLPLKHRVRRGMVLHLSLAMPWQMRQHGHDEPTYQVYALVRRVLPASAPGVKMIGLEFIGARPPAGYLEQPWLIYRPSEWKGAERRRWTRQHHSESVWVVYLDEQRQEVGQEAGQTVNISRGGARICVQRPPQEAELIKVVAYERGFASAALITEHVRRADGLHHLCVQFLEGEWPVS